MLRGRWNEDRRTTVLYQPSPGQWSAAARSGREWIRRGAALSVGAMVNAHFSRGPRAADVEKAIRGHRRCVVAQVGRPQVAQRRVRRRRHRAVNRISLGPLTARAVYRQRQRMARNHAGTRPLLADAHRRVSLAGVPRRCLLSERRRVQRTTLADTPDTLVGRLVRVRRRTRSLPPASGAARRATLDYRGPTAHDEHPGAARRQHRSRRKHSFTIPTWRPGARADEASIARRLTARPQHPSLTSSPTPSHADEIAWPPSAISFDDGAVVD